MQQTAVPERSEWGTLIGAPLASLGYRVDRLRVATRHVSDLQPVSIRSHVRNSEPSPCRDSEVSTWFPAVYSKGSRCPFRAFPAYWAEHQCISCRSCRRDQ